MLVDAGIFITTRSRRAWTAFTIPVIFGPYRALHLQAAQAQTRTLSDGYTRTKRLEHNTSDSRLDFATQIQN